MFMIIQQMVGFLLQTVPIAILVFLAFDEKDYFYGRKRTFLYITLFLALYAFIFAVAHVLNYELGKTRLLRESMMTVAIIICITMYFSLIKASKWIKGTVIIICMHYASILYYFSNFMSNFLYEMGIVEENMSMPYPLIYPIPMIVALLFTYPFLCRLMRKYIRKTMRKMEETVGVIEVMSIFLCFCVYLTGCFFLSLISTGLLALLVDICLSYLSVLTYYMFFREKESIQERNRIKEQLLLYDMEYHRITENINTARRIRHDIRQHLNTISVLNNQGRREEIAEYLKKYNAVYSGCEVRFYIDETTVNSILAYYATLCEEKDVQLDIEIQLANIGTFNPLDMTVILGNCMENALSALETVPKEERQMQVKMGKVDAALLIIVENRCKEVSCEKKGEYCEWNNFHSLRHFSAEGIGLRSISDVAEKYGGIAQFRYKDEFFTSRIMLNIF